MISKEFIRGVKDGKKAFIGPRLLQLDITNNCNTNCVGCWCHSEHLGNAKLTGDAKKVQLTLAVIKKVIADAATLKVQSIQLAGSGEPLIHPDIAEIIAYIKEQGLELEIVTNGIMLTEKVSALLVKHDVERLAVSVWAGTSETYCKIHPNQPAETCERVKKNMQTLSRMKREADKGPIVRIYNVISSYNYHEIVAMVDYAIAAEANMIEFQAVDIIAGKTDFLALKKQHVASIQKQFQALRCRKEFLKVNLFDVEELNEFGRFVIKEQHEDGFKYFFDNIAMYGVKCPIGCWMADAYEDMRHHYIGFCFDRQACNACVRFHECSIEGCGYEKRAYFLSMVGVNTFLRRIARVPEEEKATYDSMINDMPCYAGWDYSRILSNGDVIPCCKGYQMPLGNIYKGTFHDIWQSSVYETFRHNAKTLQKSDEYFKVLGCLQGCDNYGRNVTIARDIYAETGSK